MGRVDAIFAGRAAAKNAATAIGAGGAVFLAAYCAEKGAGAAQPAKYRSNAARFWPRRIIVR